MKEDPGRPLKLSQMAQLVNLSPSRLQHLFKTETGVTLTQWQRMIRLDGARDLLEHTFLSVKQIIVRVGAKDRSHFERDFKKAFGLTPTQYRADMLVAAELIFASEKVAAESAAK
jgi:transcriptional regulator GlxA family with amidase domain